MSFTTKQEQKKNYIATWQESARSLLGCNPHDWCRNEHHPSKTSQSNWNGVSHHLNCIFTVHTAQPSIFLFPSSHLQTQLCMWCILVQIWKFFPFLLIFFSNTQMLIILRSLLPIIDKIKLYVIHRSQCVLKIKLLHIQSSTGVPISTGEINGYIEIYFEELRSRAVNLRKFD